MSSRKTEAADLFLIERRQQQEVERHRSAGWAAVERAQTVGSHAQALELLQEATGRLRRAEEARQDLAATRDELHTVQRLLELGAKRQDLQEQLRRQQEDHELIDATVGELRDLEEVIGDLEEELQPGRPVDAWITVYTVGQRVKLEVVAITSGAPVVTVTCHPEQLAAALLCPYGAPTCGEATLQIERARPSGIGVVDGVLLTVTSGRRIQLLIDGADLGRLLTTHGRIGCLIVEN